MDARKPLFGGATALLEASRRLRAVDLLLLVGVVASGVGLVHLAHGWTAEMRPAIDIDLSLSALPAYALLSLSRGLAAYLLSLLFSLAYGYWAAKDASAGRVLIPLLDILQSIPVLGFMPGLVLALISAFPRSNVGLELAAILMIFTGQAWNMTFSFYHSVRSVPRDLAEVATLHGFGAWQRFRRVELPFATIGLVWNSMMSMAGGWFFLMVSETFVLGEHDFRLPGLGSYMAVATQRGDRTAMAASVVAMAAVIVVLDQLLWRPLVVWAERFRSEESGQAEAASSWFYDLLSRSGIVAWLGARLRRERAWHTHAPTPVRARGAGVVRIALLLALLAGLAFAAVGLARLLRDVSFREWGGVASATALTLLRVVVAVAAGTLWTVPAGLAIGLSPRISRLLQPVVQVVASFPAPMLFPAVIVALRALGVGLGGGSVVLMLLGTQWYVLFNVIAGASAIPADLREAARMYRLGTWQRFRALYAPAILPFLVTGWVTAAGGAWNASIVAEYVSFGGQQLSTTGIGSTISRAAAEARFPLLSAAVLAMSLTVVAFNRFVWRRLGAVVDERFSLNR